MAQRTCTIDGCERPHGARGMCYSHYGSWHRSVNGRKSNGDRYPIVCIVCGADHLGARRETKFCSDACKGKHYSLTMATKCKLPADHPVMLLAAKAKSEAKEAAAERRRERDRERSRSKFEWRTARECPGCACWFTPLYTSITITCSKRCSRRVHRWRRAARERNALGSFTWSEFMHIAARFNYCCAYCGVKPERLDPDHVVPLSRGGSNAPSNLLPTCMMCNSSKNAMTLPEWQQWRAERGQSERVTSWTIGDARYSHLTDALLIATAA